MNLMANLKDSVKQDKLVNMLFAAAVPVYSRYVPAVIGVNGWLGFITAYAPPILLGMLFKKEALTLAGIAMAVGHLTYEMTTDKADPTKGTWELDPKGAGKIEFNPTLSGYGYGVEEINGEPVLTLNGYHDTTDAAVLTLQDRLESNGYEEEYV